MPMPGRKSGSQPYRFSFQGQEKDDELKGEGNSLNYEYRMHDPRVGRFFAVDPLAAKYPYNSTYAFSENRVIDGVELEGLEWRPMKNGSPVPIGTEGIDDYRFEGYQKEKTDGSFYAPTGTVESATLGNVQYSSIKPEEGDIGLSVYGTGVISASEKYTVDGGLYSMTYTGTTTYSITPTSLTKSYSSGVPLTSPSFDYMSVGSGFSDFSYKGISSGISNYEIRPTRFYQLATGTVTNADFDFYSTISLLGVGTKLTYSAARITYNSIGVSGGSRVFWSGGKAAKNAAAGYARTHNARTLEMTIAGDFMNTVSPYLPRSLTKPIWNKLSSNFAKGAAGDINVFHNAAGVSMKSTWRTIEYPILKNSNLIFKIAY
jgi:RHS repeat-associated protein